MAQGDKVQFLETFTASSDLSTYQFHLVKLSTADSFSGGLGMDVCTSGAKCLGVLQDTPRKSYAGTVLMMGESKVAFNAALTAGKSIMSDGTGHAVQLTASNWAVGVCLQAVSLSPTPTNEETYTCTIGCLNPWKADSGFADS